MRKFFGLLYLFNFKWMDKIFLSFSFFLLYNLFFFQFVLQPLLFLSTPLDHIVASLKISSSSVHNSGHKKEDRGWKKKGKTRKEEKNGKVKSQQPIYIYIYRKVYSKWVTWLRVCLIGSLLKLYSTEFFHFPRQNIKSKSLNKS